MQAVHQGWGRRPVMRDFVTDGTWAYAIIFGQWLYPIVDCHCAADSPSTRTVAMLLNTVFYAVETTPLAGVGFSCVHLDLHTIASMPTTYAKIQMGNRDFVIRRKP